MLHTIHEHQKINLSGPKGSEINEKYNLLIGLVSDSINEIKACKNTWIKDLSSDDHSLFFVPKGTAGGDEFIPTDEKNVNMDKSDKSEWKALRYLSNIESK